MAETRHGDVAKRVLQYFVRHPDAADTYEGIVRWRLPEEAIHQTTEETQSALAWLVSRGFLRAEPIAGGPSLFRLNREQRAAAEAFLAADAGQPQPEPGHVPEREREGEPEGK